MGRRIRSHPFKGKGLRCGTCGEPFDVHTTDEPTHGPFPDINNWRECGFRDYAGVQCTRGAQLTRGASKLPYWTHRPGRKRG